MATNHSPAQNSPSHHRRLRSLLAFMLSTLLAGIGVFLATEVVMPSESAHALEHLHGPGVNWGNGIHVHGAGSFIVEGRYAYCVEPWVRSGSAIPNYVGTSVIPASSSDGVSVQATEGKPLREIAFVMARYGQTNVDVQAAAVALAIWEIRGAEGRGNSAYEAELARVRQSVGAEVVALALQFREEASSWFAAAQSSPNAENTPLVTRSGTSPYRGAVTVPPGTTELSIQNGTFPDGSRSRTWQPPGAPIGTSLSWVGEPPSEGWGKFYQVTFSGEYIAIPRTVLWGDGDGSQSSITQQEESRQPLAAAYFSADTTWAPEVSSLVTSRFVSVGEPHSDNVVFAAAPATEAMSGEWRWRVSEAGVREWMPVTAQVTAYGPFLSDPALNPSFEAPLGAPIAASASFTTDPTRNQETPQEYSVVLDQPVLEQGYYTYKWDIRGSDQTLAEYELSGCEDLSGSQKCSALPENYFFSDGFGTSGETQVGKAQPHFSTELSTHETQLEGSFIDEITIPDMPNWLRDDSGLRIPLTLTGTVYLVPGVELAQSLSVPEGATTLTTFQITTDPNHNGQVLHSPAVTIPVSTARSLRHVTVQWCVNDEDQLPSAHGMWEERCDDFGIPEESARIVHPEVRSEAVQHAQSEVSFWDSAFVGGSVPAHTALRFELFKQPVAGDPKQTVDVLASTVHSPQATSEEETANTSAQDARAPLDDEPGPTDPQHWTSSEVQALNGVPLCTTENLVFRSDASPVAAKDTGEHDNTGPTTEHDDVGSRGANGANDANDAFVNDARNESIFRSAAISFTVPGTYWWIEVLEHTDPLTGEQTVLHRGDCGLPNEMTIVSLESHTPTALASTGTSTGIAPGIWAVGLTSCGLILFGAVRGRRTRHRANRRFVKGSGSRQRKQSPMRFFPAHHLAKMK